LRTFNCGFGMVVFARAEDQADASRALQDAGLAPVEIGRLVPREDARVVMHGRLNL